MMDRMEKPVYHLMPEDLQAYPVWIFPHNGRAGRELRHSTIVRPVSGHPAVDPAAGRYAVLTEYRLWDGSLLAGYLIAAGSAKDPATTQPAIVTKSGQVPLWYGVLTPDTAAIRRNYERLGARRPETVFPIRYRTKAALTTGPMEGRIEGFMYLAAEKKGPLSRKKAVIHVVV